MQIKHIHTHRCRCRFAATVRHKCVIDDKSNVSNVGVEHVQHVTFSGTMPRSAGRLQQNDNGICVCMCVCVCV